MNTPLHFAQVLHRYVDRSLYSAGQLSQLTGIPKETIANWIDGIVQKPRSCWDLLKIASVLHLSEEEANQLLNAARHPSLDQLRPKLHAYLQTTRSELERRLLAPWLEAHPPLRAMRPPLIDPAELAAARERFAALPTASVAPVAALPSGSLMPYGVNPRFVGRDAELCRLASMLKHGASAPPVTVALTGIGGVGKTQLASEFAHRYGRFFSGGVFWISFADANAIAEQVAACGGPAYLDLRPDWSSLKLDDQVQVVRAAWSSPIPRLLIFENCEDETLLHRWRPSSGGCCVLLTCRRMTWSVTLGVQTLPLDVLERRMSIALLRRYYDAAAREETLAAIAAELGDLPLALHTSGSYLDQYRFALTPEAYLAELRQPELIHHQSLHGGAYSPTGHPQHLGRTFALSVERLNARDPVDALAHQLLARAAWFAPGEPIPRDILLASVGIGDSSSPTARRRAEDALQRLNALGLTQPGSDGAIRIHRLLVAYVRDRSVDDAAQQAVEETLIALCDRLNEAGDVAGIARLAPHLHAVADAATQRDDERAADLLATMGHYFWLQAQYDRAERCLRRCLALRQRHAERAPTKIAAACNLLALIHQLRCEFGQARQLFERALAIWERELGPDHPDTVTEHNNLGYLLLLLGEYPAAEQHLRHALHKRRAAGRRHAERAQWLCTPDIARSIHNVGYLLMKRGDYRRAQRYLKLALRIRETILPAHHVSTAMTLDFLGEVAYLLGEYEQALAYHQREREMREVLHGQAHHDIAETFYNIGRVYHALGELDTAQHWLRCALELNQRMLGADHRETVYVLCALGAVQRDRGELEESQRTLEQALTAWERLFTPGHPELTQFLNELGLTLLARGQTAAAGRIVQRALAICRHTLDQRHPQLALTLYQSGRLRQEDGDPEGALEAYLQAEVVARQRLPRCHPFVQRIHTAIDALQPQDLGARLAIQKTQQPRQ